MTASQSRSRAELYRLMGKLPDRNRPISCEKVGEESREWYKIEILALDLNGIETAPALFTLPLKRRGSDAKPARAAGGGRVPVILYNHAHGGDYVLGKRELTEGRSVLQAPPYAEALARQGVAALCIDTWALGERRGKTESETFKEMLWRGQVMWGMMVYDSLRAMDYLVSRPDVDPARIGTLGISMGSTMAWWTAALDERVKVCVDLCCMTDYEALLAARGLDGHGIYYYVPDLLNCFSTAGINALIAPRAHLCLAGNKDRLTPPAGLDRVEAELKRAYAAAGAPDAWKMLRYDCGHLETAAMRREVMQFLDERL